MRPLVPDLLISGLTAAAVRVGGLDLKRTVSFARPDTGHWRSELPFPILRSLAVRLRWKARFGSWSPGCPPGSGQHRGNGFYRDDELLSIESLGVVGLSTVARSPMQASEGWRRRESNPRPKARPRGTLHACPLLISRARREETAKNRRAPDAVCLTIRRRAAVRSPACLMTSGPRPPGEAGADAHCLIKQRERTENPQLTDVPSD